MPTVQQYQWPEAAELRRIDQDLLPELTLDDPIFEMFPIRDTNSALVVWEQKDNYLGLMQLRGFNAPAPSVPTVGSKRYTKNPSAYGEYASIDELEITLRAAPATWATPIDVSDLTSERQEQLLNRQVNRMRYNLWTLSTTGVYLVLDKAGTVEDFDSYIPQQFASIVPWTTGGTATPLADFRTIKLLHRGKSVQFNGKAKAFMNLTTFNAMIANSNQGDLFGRRKEGNSTYENLSDVNELLMKDDLPNIVIHDEGYYDDAGVFHLWIPDGVVLVVGRRSNGATIGEYLLTRNASNADNSSAPYLKIVDMGAGPNDPPPRRIDVHRGFNGGPAVYYAGASVIMKVF